MLTSVAIVSDVLVCACLCGVSVVRDVIISRPIID